MAHYEFQVMTGDGEYRSFKSVHPTNGKPYKYATRKDAETMMRVCYPMLIDEVERRVIRVEDEA